MEHHSYESETFGGFINSAFTETESFSTIQQENAKTDEIPEFNTANSTPPLFNLPSEPAESVDDKKCEKIDEISNENDLQSEPADKDAELEKPENNVKNEERSATCSNENLENAPIDDSKVDIKHTKKEVPGKKRRRILLLNDESDASQDEESALKKELLDRPSDNEQPLEKSNELDNFADNEGESDAEIENVASANKNFLKAKHLLKSAVVIGPEKKKKKHRVLESDDENDDVVNTSVDDIGLMIDNNCENEDTEIFTDNIVILNDNIYDAPEDENAAANVSNSDVAEETGQDPKMSEADDSIKKKAEEAPKPECENNDEAQKDDKEDIDKVLEKIEPMADDDDFFKFNDSSEEDIKFKATNDEYFGSPDKQNISKGKKRGPRPGTKRNPQTRSNTKPRKRGNTYDRDFVDDSESSSYSDSISSSSSSSDSSSESSPPRRAKPQPIAKKPATVIPVKPAFTITKVPVKKDLSKKDRFYDKSRNIPNDIYFGDVKVPLHVLHTRWNSDEPSRKVGKFGPNKAIQRMPVIQAPIRPTIVPTSSKSSISIPKPIIQNHDEDTKLTIMKEFMALSGLKINYAKIFNGVKSTDYKCMLLKRILAQKGMEGEPSIAKCRQLKRELQAKREIAELDKSVILSRTRRSKRGMASKDSEESLSASNNEVETTSIKPHVLETLSKIKSVIDSDSE